MSRRGIIYLSLAIPLGVFVFIYGGYDDSPGAQLLGFLIVVIGIWGAVKSKGKKIG